MEKIFSLRYQELLGEPLPQPGNWTRALVYEPTDKKTLSLRGKLFVVATLSGPKAFDLALAGKVVLDTLHEEYYSLPEGSPLQALEKALVAAHHRLVDFTYSSSGGEGVDFNIVMAALWGNVLYLAKLGVAAVYLLRGEEIKAISPTEEAQISVASGFVESGDVVILGSPKFKEHFPPQFLRGSLDRLEEVIEGLPDKSNLVGLIIRLDLKEVPSGKELIQFAFPIQSFWQAFFGKFKASVLKLKEIFRQKREFSFLFLLVFLFLFSAALTMRKRRDERIKREVAKLWQESDENLKAAADLIDLNNKRARELLEAAEDNTQRMGVLGARTQAEEALKKIKEVRQELDKLVTIKPYLLYDFKIQDSGSKPSSLTGGRGVLFVSDPETNSLFRLDIKASPVRVERLGEGEVKRPLKTDFYKNTLYGLDKNGLFRLPLEGSFEGSLVKVSEEQGEVQDLRVYFGNVYLLVPSTSKLLKYAALEEGYAEGVDWLKEDFDLSSVLSLAIDGSIYLSFKDGRVLKFTLGKREEFNLVGLPAPLSHEVYLFTSGNLPFLYLLDKEKGRVITVSKDGIYQQQYLLSSEGGDLGDLRSFWVSPEGEKLYLLAGSRILEVDLK